MEGTLPEVGRSVACRVDQDRRRRITRHHTATHILNASSRMVLGSWVWQHSAHKDEDHARLDVTHHSALTPQEISRIQETANGIVGQDLPVTIRYMDRGSAESRYGFRIYQGGVVPVRSVRIVSIGEVDVEACGGTHVDSTGQVQRIRITRAKRIQDGVVRMEFVAGPEAASSVQDDDDDGAARAGLDDDDAIKEQRRRRARAMMESLLERVPSGRGSPEPGITYGGGILRGARADYDERFHVQMGKRLTARHSTASYCGIFRSGPAIRVMVYCGEDSAHPADGIAGTISEMLGGRAAGTRRFAQGGGRNASEVDRAISWAVSELIPQ